MQGTNTFADVVKVHSFYNEFYNENEKVLLMLNISKVIQFSDAKRDLINWSDIAFQKG